MVRRVVAWAILLVACGRPIAPPEAAPASAIDAHPTFTLPRVDGRGSLSMPNGKVTVLAFLATWNEPAKRSLPGLQKLHEDLGPRGFEVLGVFVDETGEPVRSFAETYGARFPVGWDRGLRVTKQYAPSSMPTFLVLDRAGRVRARHHGYHEGTIDDVRASADALLAEE